MLRIGFRTNDNYIYCMCPRCHQVCGFPMTNNMLEPYRQCFSCKKPFVNPKLMYKDPDIRLQWHYDEDVK